MASAVDHLQEFQPNQEDLGTYLERLHLCFEANNVTVAKKMATLLTVIVQRPTALFVAYWSRHCPWINFSQTDNGVEGTNRSVIAFTSIDALRRKWKV